MLTTEFVERSRACHKEQYDYSAISATNLTYTTKVPIICAEHGTFYQSVTAHLVNKHECPRCAREKHFRKARSKSVEDFVQQAKQKHGDRYDYSSTVYTNTHSKVTVVCCTHGPFEIAATSHLRGHGCPLCSQEKRAHNCSRKLKKVAVPILASQPQEQVNNQVDVPTTQAEQDLADYVQSLTGTVRRNARDIIPPLELDLWLPQHNIAIEFNGLYWHSTARANITRLSHVRKTEDCERKGIHLIHIFEDDWQNKHDVVKSRLSNLLGKSYRLFARKCTLREVSTQEANVFFDRVHIQGACRSAHKAYALFFQEQMVSCMSFGPIRRVMGSTARKGHWELLRFANEMTYTVIGAAGRLFKAFLSNNDAESIISYADRSWTQHNGHTVYDALGMRFVGCSAPNYWYVVDGVRKHRFKYRKDRLVAAGANSALSEQQIMLQQGIYRIYNSGQLKYMWTSH